eukprot:7298115-Prymnesium_polylepis.1
MCWRPSTGRGQHESLRSRCILRSAMPLEPREKSTTRSAAGRSTSPERGVAKASSASVTACRPPAGSLSASRPWLCEA